MAKVFGSPSTQDWNQYAGGATGPSDSEERWMRQVMGVALADIAAAGHETKMGGVISASASVAESNAWGADWHIAGHSNASYIPGTGHGTECWYYTGNLTGKKMAEAIYAEVAAVSNEPDRGVKRSTGYIELKGTNADAVIVEIAFHDHEEEAQEIRQDWEEFGHAIARGVLKVIGGAAPAPVPTPVPVPVPVDTTPLLKEGDSGPEVERMQNRLLVWGQSLAPYGADGDFGAVTKAAVIRFQTQQRLGVDGIVGNETWGRLNATPVVAPATPFPLPSGHVFGHDPYGRSWIHNGRESLRDKGFVKQIQAKVGAYPDGVFGPNTRGSVIAFQRSVGVGQDGMVGPITWGKIF